MNHNIEYVMTVAPDKNGKAQVQIKGTHGKAIAFMCSGEEAGIIAHILADVMFEDGHDYAEQGMMH